ncbi:MAG: ATP-binding protein [Actinomycetes bacterium]
MLPLTTLVMVAGVTVSGAHPVWYLPALLPLAAGVVSSLRVPRPGTGTGTGTALGAAAPVRTTEATESPEDAVSAGLLVLAERASCIVFRIRLHPTVEVHYLSPSIERVLGIPAHRLVAEPAALLEILHPSTTGALVDTLPGDGAAPTVLRCRHAHGRDVVLEVHRREVRDADGVVVEGIARDVTDRHATEVALTSALADEHATASRLRELDRMKSSFLSAISHELRTPLASVLGFAETLEENLDLLPREQVDMVVDRILVNARRLDRLIGDLLDVERLMRGTLEPNLREVDLALLAERVLEQLERPDRRLVIDLAPASVTVDVPKIERVVESLVVNAHRHTPGGTTVWVAVRPADDGVELVVEDDGPGIPTELAEQVFEPFDQSAGTPTHAPGTGMGLSLVARFVELHGGDVTVTPREGGGASFRVWLPAQPVVDIDQLAHPRRAVLDPAG